MRTGDGDPFWLATAPETGYPELAGDLAVDVAVVGGGIVGLTTALLAKQAGRSVALLEARRVGRQASGRSTAKVTCQHAAIYARLVRTHGREGARAYAEANQEAVERVAGLARELAIECDLQRKPAYVYAASQENVGMLEHEAECAREFGLPAEIVRDAALPFGAKAALCFRDQLQIHPCKYAAGLARHVDGGGCRVFECSRVLDVEAGPPARVVTATGTVTAGNVVVATHLPITSHGLFFSRAYPQCEPVLAARIDPERAPEGMLISAESPTLSAVSAPGPDGTYLIAAGGSFKPGHPDDEREAFAGLERRARERFGDLEVRYRWTNHDYVSMDGVPFVGRASGGSGHLYVATGFGAWGLSNGTAAGVMLTDLIAGRASRWGGLFDATRKKPLVSAPKFVAENAHVASELVTGYLASRPSSVDDLAPGEGAVLRLDGARVAACRDAAGRLHKVSAVCTHMGCIVGWNPVEGSWDCPCHGSRFAADGAVISGPAVSPLRQH